MSTGREGTVSHPLEEEFFLSQKEKFSLHGNFPATGHSRGTEIRIWQRDSFHAFDV